MIVIGDIVLLEIPKTATDFKIIGLSTVSYKTKGRESSMKLPIQIQLPRYDLIGACQDIKNNNELIKRTLLDPWIDYIDKTETDNINSFISWLKAYNIQDNYKGLLAVKISQGNKNIRWFEKLPKTASILSPSVSKDNDNNLVRLIPGKKKVFITNKWGVEVEDEKGNKKLNIENFEVYPNRYFLVESADGLQYLYNTDSFTVKKKIFKKDPTLEMIKFINLWKNKIHILKEVKS